jgi:hypothetical protein
MLRLQQWGYRWLTPGNLRIARLGVFVITGLVAAALGSPVAFAEEDSGGP